MLAGAREKRMVDARKGGLQPCRPARPWRRRLVAIALAPAAVLLLGAAAAATPVSAAPDPLPSASPTPTPIPPTPTPTPLRGTLPVVKTAQSGATIKTPGARFNVHRARADGPVGPPLTP